MPRVRPSTLAFRLVNNNLKKKKNEHRFLNNHASCQSTHECNIV